MIREATNADCPGIIELVDSVYREYDDRIWLPGADADLTDVEAYYWRPGGGFWVLDLNGEVCGTHGTLPIPEQPGVCRFRRLYLSHHFRGSHWGHALMQHTLDWARLRDFTRVEFWSDSRFKRAHRFFAKFGFQPDGRSREMLDGHQPYRELFYSLDLGADRELG